MWKNMYFQLQDLQTGMISLHREMEKGPLCKISQGEENLSITVWIGCYDMLFVQILCMVDALVHGTCWCMVDALVYGTC